MVESKLHEPTTTSFEDNIEDWSVEEMKSWLEKVSLRSHDNLHFII